jgi:UDP-glucose 4-epimerase
MPPEHVLGFYRGRRTLITGGLGFIGSNLARRLVELGADVVLVDSLIPEYGATGRTSPGSNTL